MTETLTNWRGFISPHIEAEYRQHQLPYDRARGRLFAWMLMIGMTVFAFSDYRIFGGSAQFFGLLSMRVAAVIACVATLLYMRKATWRELDKLQLIIVLASAVGTVIVVQSRPAGYFGHSIVTVGLVFGMYFVVPLPWYHQLLAAALTCIGDAWFTWSTLPADRLTVTAIVTSFVLANLVGIYASRELDTWKRRQFVALRAEQLLRDQLEQALAEIKTLEGILPICSHCKNVRDDTGDWHTLEEYVHEHTEAEFTHGLCPSCLSRHYAEFEAEAESRG